MAEPLRATGPSTTAVRRRAVARAAHRAGDRRLPRMDDAASYEEWKAAAQAHDERSGAARWRQIEASRRYDYQVIRRRLDEIRRVRASGDLHRILYYLNEGIHGNMGGMGSSKLYRRAKFGTKDLVTAYIEEQAAALEQVADAPDDVIGLGEKLEFFRRASHCFGRTALMLSGAGALGPFHVGVIKALHEQGLLPNVISGSSAGALVAAIVGTRGDDALADIFDSRHIVQVFGEAAEAEADILKGNRRLGVREVRAFIEHQIPDLTFQQAFERTGRRINISVSPRELHQQSRLLNAITSPNVCIREAVLASCAIPGIFPPVTLAARDRHGERQPYVPSRQWVDGSVTDDLPAKRLIRLYGVNHFITSQTNPVAIWALRDSQAQDSLLSRLWEINQNASREVLKATYPFAMELTRNLYPLNVVTRMFYSIATQDYTADINILPRRRFWDPRKLLSVLSEGEVRTLIREGEAATWPRIEMIRNCTRISRTLDAILARLEEQNVYAHA
jgi:TAG lipase / steryl ester hydrolase / phospholipase A2 / LPA acyltransferase